MIATTLPQRMKQYSCQLRQGHQGSKPVPVPVPVPLALALALALAPLDLVRMAFKRLPRNNAELLDIPRKRLSHIMRILFATVVENHLPIDRVVYVRVHKLSQLV